MVLIDQTLPGAATLPRLVEIPLSEIGNNFTVHLSGTEIAVKLDFKFSETKLLK